MFNCSNVSSMNILLDSCGHVQDILLQMSNSYVS